MTKSTVNKDCVRGNGKEFEVSGMVVVVSKNVGQEANLTYRVKR